MLNLAVIYGGQSCERDISVITAVQIMGMIDRHKYNVLPIMITEGNVMVMPEYADRISSYIDGENSGKEVYIKGKALMSASGLRRRIADIDCALLCVHGGMGEGGSLQGLLDMHGIPYTSPSVEASAVCMNKALSKGIFSALGANILPCVLLDKSSRNDYVSCADKLGFPIIVKPARQGSSIGINVAKNIEELKDAIDTAFEYDSEIIAEKALTDYKEINCACVYSCGEVLASTLERPLSWHDFLTFEDKYMSDGKINAGDREFPAVLAPQTAAAIRDCAVKLYKGLDMRGVVRMDFLLDNTDNTAYINEINTIPGSLANYLFKDKGIDGGRLIDILVSEAIKAKEQKKTVKYSSRVLESYGKASAKGCKSGCKRI